MQTDLVTGQPCQVALACPGTAEPIQPFGLLAPNVNMNCVLFALCFFSLTKHEKIKDVSDLR